MRFHRTHLQVILALLLSACAADRLANPTSGANTPEPVLRALKASGLTTRAVVAQRVGGSRGPEVAVGLTGQEVGAAQTVDTFFSVHPNGGTRSNLRQKEIESANPTQLVTYQLLCEEPGIGWTPTSGEVDSLYHGNTGSATGGHGTGHDFSNTATGRPLGTYDKTSGPTSPAGVFGPTLYTANIASGEERVLLRVRFTQPGSACNDGTTSTFEFRAIVEVPDLVEISPSANVTLVPPTSDHPASSFWFLNSSTGQMTLELGRLHQEAFELPVLLTAASLVQGGINDVSKNWDTRPLGHWEHRTGGEIDIDDQANNDPKRLKLISNMGLLAGFVLCESHGTPVPNHVHCSHTRYE